MSSQSQLDTLTGSDQDTVKNLRAEHQLAHTKHYSAQDAASNASLGKSDHRAHIDVPTLAFVKDSSSEHYPIRQEHRDIFSGLHAEFHPRAESWADSRNDDSQSLAEIDKQFTNGTSRTVPVSLLGSDDLESEPEDLSDQTYLPTSEFRKLDKRRLRLVTGQLNLRESRKVLRRQRNSIAEQQRQLLQEFRALVVRGGKPDLDNLLGKIQAIQVLLETLETHEDEYDRKEKLLIDDEWKFRDAEEKLLYQHHVYGRERSGKYSEQENTGSQLLDDTLSTAAESASSGTWTVLRSDPPSLNQLQFVRARLEKLRSEHRQLMDEEKLRRDLGLALDEDSWFALRVFPVREAELLHYLDFYEESAAERQAIFEDSFDQFPVFQYTGHDLEMLAQQNTPGTPFDLFAADADEILLNESDKTPEMLMPWTSDNEQKDFAVFPYFASQRGFSIRINLFFINDWLFHMLRCSSLALLQLRLIFSATKTSVLPQEYTALVLSCWYNDETSSWYTASRELAAQSLDPTTFSESQSTRLHTAFSDPNLLLMRRRVEPVGQSRSLFARRREVADLANSFKRLDIAK